MSLRQRFRIGALVGCCLAIAQPPASASKTAMAELQRLIGDARCVSDDQCRTIAVGTIACGGPQAYLAWSSLRTDPVALEAAAARYTAGQGSASPRGGDASTCRVVPDPGALCQTRRTAPDAASPRRGVCRLRDGSGAGGAPNR